MEKDKKSYLHLQVEKEQLKALKKRAIDLDLTVSEYIRVIFNKELKENFLDSKN